MGRRIFAREFKLEAVKLVKERGVVLGQAARDLDVGEGVLRRWVKEFAADPGQAFPGQGQLKPEQAKLERLRRENAKLKAERDILKNRPRGVPRLICLETSGAACFLGSRGLLCKGIDMRFGFIAKHRGVWPTRWICETLDVSPGGFYEWLRPGQCERARMVDEPPDDIAAGNRCVHDGDLAPKIAQGTVAPFRPGQPIHERTVPAFAGRSRRDLQHESIRQLLG